MTALLLTLGAAVVGVLLAWLALAPWVRLNLRTSAWRPAVRVWMTVALALGAAVVVVVAGVGWQLPVLLLFAACGTAFSAVDLLERRVPNRMLLVAAPLLAVAILVGAAGLGSAWPLLWCAVGAAGLFLIYLVIALVAPSAMGMGDVKLAALVGGVLGFIGPAAILDGAVAIAVVGGVAAVIVLATSRGGDRGVPYAPALVIGALIGSLVAVVTG
jgi:leader peptidase (prepilin peptidase)/N-methyltransferase